VKVCDFLVFAGMSRCGAVFARNVLTDLRPQEMAPRALDIGALSFQATCAVNITENNGQDFVAGRT
jgi:hypothetical protein